MPSLNGNHELKDVEEAAISPDTAASQSGVMVQISGVFPEKDRSPGMRAGRNADLLISILRRSRFRGYEAGPVLSNERGAVNSALLRGSWQETVLEDNLFTRREVIARLDLSAQPKKHPGRFSWTC